MKQIIYLLLLLACQSLFAQKLEKAQRAFADNDYSTAKQLYLQVIKSEAKNSQAYFGLTEVELANKNWDEAEEAIEKALAIEPNNLKYWMKASDVYGVQAAQSSIFSKLGYAKDVKRALQKVLSINPQQKEAIIGLIQFHMMAPGIAGGDADQLPILVSRLEKVDLYEAIGFRAQMFFNDGEDSKAYAIFDQAIKEHPNSWQLYFKRAAHYISDKHYQKSLNDLKKLLSFGSNNTKSSEYKMMIKTQHQALYQTGKVAAESGLDLEYGKRNLYNYLDLKVAAKETPESWVRFRLGQILYQQNHPEYAKAQFENLATLSPDKNLKKALKKFKKKNRIQ